LKRYSLVSCFRNRDSLPFYNKNLDDIYLKNDKNLSTKYSSSIINQQQNSESKKSSIQQIASTLLLRKQHQEQSEEVNKSITSNAKPIYFYNNNDSKLSLGNLFIFFSLFSSTLSPN
jgi:hypothetical protein